MKKIQFTVFYSKKTGQGLGCKFPDGAFIIIRKGGIYFMFPKNKKFITIFRKQLENKKRDHIGIAFSKDELRMLQKALSYKSLKRRTRNSSHN